MAAAVLAGAVVGANMTAPEGTSDGCPPAPGQGALSEVQ